MQNGGEVDVLVYFAALAKQACPGHECDGLGHLGPAELGGDEALCCPHPRVVDGVQRLENCLSQLDGNKRVLMAASYSVLPAAMVHLALLLYNWSAYSAISVQSSK